MFTGKAARNWVTGIKASAQRGRRPTHTPIGTQIRLDSKVRITTRASVTPPRKVPKPKNAAERKARIARILAELDRIFPSATCALHHENPWQLLVATILSAQCTDERVNKVTPGLFRKYPTVEDFAHASQDELANDIRSTGFFNNKAKSIVPGTKPNGVSGSTEEIGWVGDAFCQDGFVETGISVTG